MNRSFKDCRQLLQKVNGLPQGPGWTQEIITVTDDATDEEGTPEDEELELWLRDPVECIAELIGNPAFNAGDGVRPQASIPKQGRACLYL